MCDFVNIGIICKKLRADFTINLKYYHKWKAGLSKQASQYPVFDSFARLARLQPPRINQTVMFAMLWVVLYNIVIYCCKQTAG